MTLYAAGLADRECLEAEVEREIALQVPVGPVTYLAQAFVYADDAEVSIPTSMKFVLPKKIRLNAACLRWSVAGPMKTGPA